MCQCYLELEKVIKPSPFYLDYFSLLKNFNYITKDASILHLKSNNSGRPSYFLTSTFHDTPPITMVDILQVVGCCGGLFLTLDLY
jgi:hypothetical protein